MNHVDFLQAGEHLREKETANFLNFVVRYDQACLPKFL